MSKPPRAPHLRCRQPRRRLCNLLFRNLAPGAAFGTPGRPNPVGVCATDCEGRSGRGSPILTWKSSTIPDDRMIQAWSYPGGSWMWKLVDGVAGGRRSRKRNDRTDPSVAGPGSAARSDCRATHNFPRWGYEEQAMTTTIDFGIDLGTTNSCVARWDSDSGGDPGVSEQRPDECDAVCGSHSEDGACDCRTPRVLGAGD